MPNLLSQLLQHHDEVLRMLEEDSNVDVIYTDFEKAYKKVDHEKRLKNVIIWEFQES